MQNCKIVAIEHLTLDGVYQAPARTDEDQRDAFKHGGWSTATDAPDTTQRLIGKYMQAGWRLLAGRTTYEDLYEGWHVRQPDHPMTQALTNVQKFVASRNSNYKPAWDNSTLLRDDATRAVAELKSGGGTPLIVFGSGVLVRSLISKELVDDLVLMIHPVVLGEGRRFFADGPFTKFQLVDEVKADTGVLVATYRLLSAAAPPRPNADGERRP
jgi:dihydrofolate reductase